MTSFAALREPIGIAGFGVEGRATLRALRRSGVTSQVTIFVDAPVDDAVSVEGVQWCVGDNGERSQRLAHLATLIRSPGIKPSHPLLVEARRKGVLLTTSTNLYIERVRAEKLPVIGITGSKGKSTTSSLVHAILHDAGMASVLVGNIGHAALDAMDDVIANRAISVFEMSSYQCNDLTLGPSLAVLLCLFPEHLDWHGDLDGYYGAKLNITRSQQAGDSLVFGAHQELLCEHVIQVHGKSRRVQQKAFGIASDIHVRDGVFYRADERLFDGNAMQLRGAHNKLNACAALTVCEQLGVAPSNAANTICEFTNLPHRLEVLGAHGGVVWVNDSISTAPEAGEAALEAFGDSVGAMIVGGFDRGYDFTQMARAVVKAKVPLVALLPSSGLRLLSCFEQLQSLGIAVPETLVARDVEHAVSWVSQRCTPGKTCLFSPSSPSYGVYRDFQERGEHFKKLVRALLPTQVDAEALLSDR